MPKNKPQNSANEDDAMASLFSLGLLVLAGVAIYRFITRNRPTVEDRQLSGMEAEIARMRLEDDFR